jgi:hypothetical protein
MNYEEFYLREREIKAFHKSFKRPGGPECFAGRVVPERSLKIRKRTGRWSKVLRSFLNMFH